MPDESTEEHRLWSDSRSGAHAGRGFRFQDNAAACAAILCWSGQLDGQTITPEGFDDFSIKSKEASTYVQVKSKSSPDISFGAGELAAIFLEHLQKKHQDIDPNARQIVLIDRPFVEKVYDNWSKSLALEPKIKAAISKKLGEEQSQFEEEYISRSTLITLSDPKSLGTQIIAERRNIPLTVAGLCFLGVSGRIGGISDDNASRSYEDRSKIAIAEVDKIIVETEALVDISSLDDALRSGAIDFVDFNNLLPDDHFYQGVGVQPGHIAAGLAIDRPSEVANVMSGLERSRRVVISGPSGSGKSALAYLVAFQLQDHFRFFRLQRFRPDDRNSLLDFFRARSPKSYAPICIIIDNAVEGKEYGWDIIANELSADPNVYVIATIREEDLVLLKGQEDAALIRPSLDPSTAEAVWTKLAQNNQTKWEHWREPFEMSNGLFLEYSHILTQGDRLDRIIDAQVGRRLDEKRDAEFDILRLASAATSVGASVDVSRLRTFLGLSSAESARALRRLIEEHLINQIDGSTLGGLHELRSKAIQSSCQEMHPESLPAIQAQALSYVTADGARSLLSAMARTGDLDQVELFSNAMKRCSEDPDPEFFAGLCEGLSLSRLARDAALYVELAEETGISPKFYMLAVISSLTSFTPEDFEKDTPFSKLAKFTQEFEERRSIDPRTELIEIFNDDVLLSIINGVNSTSQALRLMGALAAIRIPDEKIGLWSGLYVHFSNAPLEDTVEFLKIAYEANPGLAQIFVERLGGSGKLLQELRTHTDWALPSTIETNSDSELEVCGNLLSVCEPLSSEPDAIIFDYASSMLALAPEAQKVTSQPVTISGDPITIKDYTPGLKSFGRKSSHSKASVTWNRMMLYAVLQLVGADSTSQLMMRRAENIAVAIDLLEKAIDKYCRGKPLPTTLRLQIEAVKVIEDMLPAMPALTPEKAFNKSLKDSFDDPAGNLISDILDFSSGLLKNEHTGIELSYELESLQKAIQPAMTDLRWQYIAKPPTKELKKLIKTGETMRSVLDACGDTTRDQESCPLPSNPKWGTGKGLRRATQTTKLHIEKQLRELRSNIFQRVGKLGAEIHVHHHDFQHPKHHYCPPHDIFIAVEVQDFVGFAEWLEEALVPLETIRERVSLLTIGAQMDGYIIPSLAFRLLEFGPLPDPEGILRWKQEANLQVLQSEVMSLFDEVLASMTTLYAAQNILVRDKYRPEELVFLETEQMNAEEKIRRLDSITEAENDQRVINALLHIMEQNEATQSDQGDSSVNLARESLDLLMGGELTENHEELIDIRMNLVDFELKKLSTK